MLLITSGAFVGDELASEFGKIPPAFLPIGNKRLIYRQLDQVPHRKEVYLSIPESYQISKYDERHLKASNVNIIRVPERLSLGESVVYALNIIGIYDQELMLLHGDTYVKDLRDGDQICLGKTKSAYQWEPEGDSVWAGYFSFRHVRDLIKSLVSNDYKFVAGVRAYSDSHNSAHYHDETWLDFGHINTYYQSKSHITTERSFNSLNIVGDVVTKRSTNRKKVAAEKNWYVSLPTELKVYTPQFLEALEDGYKIEYQYLPSLSEIYVFGELSANVWEEITSKAFSILSGFRKYTKDEPSTDYILGMFKEKTLERLQKFEQQSGFSINEAIVFNGATVPSLLEIYSETLAPILAKTDGESLSLLHGDMCFSNMLYDFRRGNLKLIDPRGLSNTNDIDIYGSWWYDLAKLFHSFTGNYDWIIAGYFNITAEQQLISFELDDDARLAAIAEVAAKQLKQKFDIEIDDLMPFVIHLFLSMLPLHDDNEERQMALMSNAIRLYINWRKH